MQAWFQSGDGQKFPLSDLLWTGPGGGLLDIVGVEFDRAKIKASEHGLWRYREMIPIGPDATVVSMGEGYTPIVPLRVGSRDVLIKQEQLFPTGSYKDRGAAVLMSKAVELGVKHVVQDSSGNAGCSVAAYGARCGISCDIYVPADTAAAKLAQLEWYGARIHRIPGSREDTAAAALGAAGKTYYASHCYNPFFFQGTKTFAYEVCEQLGWKSPDAVVLPAGNGTLVIGCFIGFAELLKAGVIDKMPKLIAVQAAACAPLFNAFKGGLNDAVVQATMPTLAEGIAIAKPVRGSQIMRYVRETDGTFLAVSEQEISGALELCAAQGFYIEPTSAATIAGLRQYISSGGSGLIVSLFSGHGLKAGDKMMKLKHQAVSRT